MSALPARMNAVVPGQIDGKPAPVIQEIAVPGPRPA